jgi:hypothetical protein
MEITIRPIRDRERETFLERVVATTHADLPDHQRTRLTAKEIFYSVADVVDLLMARPLHRGVRRLHLRSVY